MKEHICKYKNSTSESGVIVTNQWAKFASITILYCECGKYIEIKRYFRANGKWED